MSLLLFISSVLILEFILRPRTEATSASARQQAVEVARPGIVAEGMTEQLLQIGQALELEGRGAAAPTPAPTPALTPALTPAPTPATTTNAAIGQGVGQS